MRTCRRALVTFIASALVWAPVAAGAATLRRSAEELQRISDRTTTHLVRIEAAIAGRQAAIWESRGRLAVITSIVAELNAQASVLARTKIEIWRQSQARQGAAAPVPAGDDGWAYAIDLVRDPDVRAVLAELIQADGNVPRLLDSRWAAVSLALDVRLDEVRSLVGQTESNVEARARLVQRRAVLRRSLEDLEVAQSRLAAVVDPKTEPQPSVVDSYGTWARAFLDEIGAPGCRENLIAVVAWETQEGTAARWNPLATTYALPGAPAFNSVGVRDYATLAQGLRATVTTLREGSASYGYEAILDSLVGCRSAQQTADAIRASSWCSGCTQGRYVTGLIDLVRRDPASFAARPLG